MLNKLSVKKDNIKKKKKNKERKKVNDKILHTEQECRDTNSPTLALHY